MNVFGFKTFSVGIVSNFRDVPYTHVAIYMICVVCLFLRYEVSCSVRVVDVPA